MDYLNQKDIKNLVKEEIFKAQTSKIIEEQLKTKLASWIAEKVPSSSQDQIIAAIDAVLKEEGIENLNINEFVEAVRAGIAEQLEDTIGEYMSNIVNNAIRQAGEVLGK